MSEFQIDFTKLGVDSEALEQAVAVGGKVTDAEKMSGAGSGFPYYAVVGSGSKDALYDLTLPSGETIKASRAGQFKFTDGEDVTYHKQLFPLVILGARTEQTCFGPDNRPVCRGISTDKLYKPVCISGFWQPGTSCEHCGMYQFNKSGVHPVSGLPVTKDEKCGSGLTLFGWNPGEDPEGLKVFKVQFSSSSVKVWRDWSKQFEAKGAKLFAFWLGLQTLHNAGDAGRSDFYTPQFAVGGVLSPEQFKVAERLQKELTETINSIVTPLPVLNAPAARPALPASAVSNYGYEEDIPLPDDPFQDQ